MRCQKWYPPLLSSAVFVLALSAVSPPVYSQVLVTEPGCGKAGDTVRVTGSGWAEPNPVCEYRFFFDSTEFIGRQPDGLFGPPNRTGTIPAGATPGEHTIKVELRLTSDGSLLQCRQTMFRVVADVKDPWNATTPGGKSIKIEFNPTDVCDVTPCTKIVFVQVVTLTGEKADGTTRTLTYSDIAFPDAAKHQVDVSNGWKVDYLIGESDPYYNGDDPSDNTSQGTQGKMPTSATMTDAPFLPDSSYPADIVKLLVDFEVTGFCAAGSNKGEFLGNVKWRWQRSKGGAGSVSVVSTDRNAPSQNLLNALSTWNTNHSFTLPTKTAPTTGGQPCS